MVHLPADVWLEIVLHVVDSSPPFPLEASPVDKSIAIGYVGTAGVTNEPRQVKHSAKPLSLVCRQWRTLIRGCSRCYVTSICIPLLSVERGQSLPLLEQSRGCDIIAVISYFQSDFDTMVPPFQGRPLRALTSVLKKYRTQWLVLNLFIAGTLLSALNGLQFPRLRTLTLGMRDQEGLADFKPDAPELQFLRVSLHANTIPLEGSFRFLQVLSLFLPKNSSGFLPRFLSCLDSVRDLNLSARSDIPDDAIDVDVFQPTAPFMPNLQRLWLDWGPQARWPCAIMSALGDRKLELISCKLNDHPTLEPTAYSIDCPTPSPKCIQWAGYITKLPFNPNGATSLLIRGLAIVQSRDMSGVLCSFPSLTYLHLDGISARKCYDLLSTLWAPNLFKMRLDLISFAAERPLQQDRVLEFENLREITIRVPTSRQLDLLQRIRAPALYRLEILELTPLALKRDWEQRILLSKHLLPQLLELRIPDGVDMHLILQQTPRLHTLHICSYGEDIHALRFLQSSKLRLKFWRHVKPVLLPNLQRLSIENYRNLDLFPRASQVTSTISDKQRVVKKGLTKHRELLAAGIRALIINRKSNDHPLQQVSLNQGWLSSTARKAIVASGVEFIEEQPPPRLGGVRWVSFF